MSEGEDDRRKAEFTEYLRRNQGRLYEYIHSLVRELNDADDLFQQTTLILWRKFGEFDRSRSFFAWGCGVAWLEVRNFLRSRGRNRLLLSDEVNLLLVQAHGEETNDEPKDLLEALERCIEELGQQDRELLDACYQDSAGVHRTAERSGRSTQSIYNSLRRIRRALHDCIVRVRNE